MVGHWDNVLAIATIRVVQVVTPQDVVDRAARGVVGLGPGVDGVDEAVGVQEEGEHFCAAHRQAHATLAVRAGTRQ